MICNRRTVTSLQSSSASTTLCAILRALMQRRNFSTLKILRLSMKLCKVQFDDVTMPLTHIHHRIPQIVCQLTNMQGRVLYNLCNPMLYLLSNIEHDLNRLI